MRSLAGRVEQLFHGVLELFGAVLVLPGIHVNCLPGATFADSMIPGQQMTVMATVLSAPSLAAAQDMTRQVEQTGAAPPPPKPMSLGPPNAEAKIQAAPSQDMTCAALESSVTKETTFASPSVDTCEKRPEKHDLRSPVQMIRPEEVSLASPVPPNPESAESQVRHEAATSPSTFAPEVHAPRDVEVHPAPAHPVRPDLSEAVPRTAVQPAGAVWAVEGSAVFAKPQASSAEAESTVEVKPETDAAAEPAELELLQQPQQLQSEAASNTAFSQPRMKPVACHEGSAFEESVWTQSQCPQHISEDASIMDPYGLIYWKLLTSC